MPLTASLLALLNVIEMKVRVMLTNQLGAVLILKDFPSFKCGTLE